MEARVRSAHAVVYANIGVHADVEITLEVDLEGGEGATIRFGHLGPDVIMDFADADSLERLANLAADGARQLRDRTTSDRVPTAD